MGQTLKKYIMLLCKVFCMLIVGLTTVSAAHIAGGEMVYTCIDPDPTDTEAVFQINLTIYRDLFSGGAQPDGDADFGVYEEVAPGDWRWVGSVTGQNFELRTVIPVADTNPCVDIPDNVGIEQYSYIFDIAVPITSNSYMVVYQRCCRNGTINNLLSPGDTGAAFFVEISPQAQSSCDNSPVFNELPPIFICQNIYLEVDHSASDSEGDDLLYSFCAPKTAGGTAGSSVGSGSPESCEGVTPLPSACTPPFADVTYIDPDGTANGFTSATPLAGNPVIQIDPITGVITGIPEQLGQYVVGVCVQAFRNGNLISEIIRDFQFNVVECDPVVLSNLESGEIIGPKQYYYSLCGENQLEIVNSSVQIDRIISYEWVMDINGVFDTIVTRDASYDFPSIGQYSGTMILNKNTDCADTAFITVDVFPSTVADFSFAYDTCVPGPVEFLDLSTTLSSGIATYEWNFGETIEDTSNEQNPHFEYPTPGVKTVMMMATDANGCVSQRVQDVTYYPVAETLITAPSSFVGCVPSLISFNNLSEPINEEYTTLWTFGDGGTSDELAPSHLYEVQGNYTVSLEVISPIGCTNERTFNSLIEARPSPIADFTCTPEEFNAIENKIYLIDRSTFAERLNWIVPGVGTSNELNPNFTFPDTGLYQINLIAIHESGCPDTMTKIIDVVPLSNLFFPNAFTPNNDGKNDSFKPVGFAAGSVNYEMSVWNRWGEVIYTSNTISEGWNGTKNNNGTDSPEGTYIYTYSYISGRGEVIEGKGKIILLR